MGLPAGAEAWSQTGTTPHPEDPENQPKASASPGPPPSHSIGIFRNCDGISASESTATCLIQGLSIIGSSITEPPMSHSLSKKNAARSGRGSQALRCAPPIIPLLVESKVGIGEEMPPVPPNVQAFIHKGRISTPKTRRLCLQSRRESSAASFHTGDESPLMTRGAQSASPPTGAFRLQGQGKTPTRPSVAPPAAARVPWTQG